MAEVKLELLENDYLAVLTNDLVVEDSIKSESNLFKTIFSARVTLRDIGNSSALLASIKKENEEGYSIKDNVDTKLLKKWNITKNLQVNLTRLHDVTSKYIPNSEVEKVFMYRKRKMPKTINFSPSTNSNQRKKDFYCKECEFFTSNNRNFKIHIRKYHKNVTKAFPCKFCEKSFVAKPFLRTHYTKCQSESSIKRCNYCKDWFLISQFETHGNAPPLKCKWKSCKKHYYCPYLFKLHKQTHSLPNECPECKKRFSYPGNLKAHVKMIHKKIERFFCPDCNRGFFFEKCMKRHARSHYSFLKRTDFVCHVCDHRFPCKTSLTLHITSIHFVSDEKKFFCSVCSKGFGEKLRYERHLERHVRKKYPCKTCFNSYTKLESLEKHVEKAHSGERKFTCDTCGGKFLSYACLKRHSVIHNGKYYYTCDICEKQCKLKTTMRTHILTHFPDRKKPFACHLCSSRFFNNMLLKSHLYSHSSKRAYKCPHCSKDYQRPGCVSRHIKNAHRKS